MGPRYHAWAPCGAQLSRLPGVLWAMIIVPSGPIGVQLKSKAPWIFAWAERHRLMREAQSKLSVTCNFSIMQSQSCIRNSGSLPQRTEINNF